LTDRVESTDFYFGLELLTKIKGFSTIPPIEDVKEAVSAIAEKRPMDGKKQVKTALTSSEALVAAAIEEFDKGYGKMLTDMDKRKYLSGQDQALGSEIKGYLRSIAQSKFSLILSRKWFSDLKPENNEVTAVINGTTFPVTFEWHDEKVKL
jgi:hypothetical protein